MTSAEDKPLFVLTNRPKGLRTMFLALFTFDVFVSFVTFHNRLVEAAIICGLFGFILFLFYAFVNFLCNSFRTEFYENKFKVFGLLEHHEVDYSDIVKIRYRSYKFYKSPALYGKNDKLLALLPLSAKKPRQELQGTNTLDWLDSKIATKK